MQLLRYFVPLMWVGICTTSELSVRERIEKNKAWLEQRVAYKENYTNVTTNRKNDFYRKIIRFSENYKTNEILPQYKMNRKQLSYANEIDFEPLSESTSTTTAVTPITTMPTPVEDARSSTPIDADYIMSSSTKLTTSLTTPQNTLITKSRRRMLSIPTHITVMAHEDPIAFEPTVLPVTTSTETTSPLPPPSIKKPSGKKKSPNKWSSWSKWGPCSRSCGGGIKTQSRQCLSKTSTSIVTSNNDTSVDCIGLYKRFHICNEQSCPNPDVDFREEQCAQYNNHIFKGKKYEWEAYVKDDAECELNCKPIGLNYFATLNETVINGTPCSKATDLFRKSNTGRAVCVEGICKVVHNSGVISGSVMNNGAVRCGTQVCRPISGIFSKSNLQNGYIHVATIPMGASNISITEMKNSMNLLVLKSGDSKFIINGDHKMSDSGPYEAAGSVIDYRRIDGATNSTTAPAARKSEGITEWITCMGPTTEPLYLMVLAQHHNPGIKYEYLLPIHPNMITNSDEERDLEGSTSSSSEGEISEQLAGELAPKLKSGSSNSTGIQKKRKRQFLWKVIGFNACSKSCGGGVQTPIIRCVREAPTRIFAPRRCAHLQQPILNEQLLKCNQQPCPAYWKVGEWRDCNCDSYSEENFQLRDVNCVQELGTGMIISVNRGACLEDSPTSQKECDCPKFLKTPQLEVYKHTNAKPHQHHHHHTLSDIQQIRQNLHTIPKNHTTKRPIHNESKKNSGVWLVSDWNEECSVDCGLGVQYRTVFCDRSPPNIERCDLKVTPETTRQCKNELKCKYGHWFIGPWTDCSGDCFNLKKKRTVFCIREDVIIPDAECNPDDKPENSIPCQPEDVNDCRPKWHYSDWLECSKACDSGTQKRTIKCFEPNVKDKLLKESQNCRYSERPSGYRNCNAHDCNGSSGHQHQTTTEHIDPRVDLIQNDIQGPECKDEFPNCHLVIKARLCNYEYYNQNCCHSCRDHNL